MIPDEYFARFDTQKYQNKNPVQRALIRRFVTTLHDLFIEGGPFTSVLEVGVGEGFISGYLSEKFPAIKFTGIDLSANDIDRLSSKFPRVEGHVGSAYELGALPGGYDLVICAEVLEHLDTPDRALDAMLAHKPRRLLLSVPHEPFFMLSNLARGKNVSRFGNDPEHVNHWGTSSFRRMLSTRLDVLRLTTSYPWILALTAPR
ncbi:SAM-dependent methyltransferase [Minicystis rosea]|nr:SAM-dependent methyltransferase [Minicystis rosea]